MFLCKALRPPPSFEGYCLSMNTALRAYLQLRKGCLALGDAEGTVLLENGRRCAWKHCCLERAHYTELRVGTYTGVCDTETALVRMLEERAPKPQPTLRDTLPLNFRRKFYYSADNMQTTGVMHLHGTSFVFVHVSHPTVDVICKADPSATASLIEEEWLRIEQGAFDWALESARPPEATRDAATQCSLRAMSI